MEEENKEVQKKPERDSIASMITKLGPQFKNALPSTMTSERFQRIALTAIRNNIKLGQCDIMSLMASLMTSAQLGLEPNTPLGEAYLIPYGEEAQFQVGYKGILKLAHQTGQYKQITAHSVDKADKFIYKYGLNPELEHEPTDKPTGETIAYYAVYHLVNGGYDFKVWSKEKAEAHGKKYSKSYGNGPWKTNFDQMAMKTVLIDLLKTAPKATEQFSRALASDNMTFKMNLEDPDLTIDGSFEEA